MNAPVITALTAYVPPVITLKRWYRIEARLRATAAPSGWNAWLQSWRAQYDSLDQSTVALMDRLTTRPGTRPQVDRIPVEQHVDQSGLAARVAQAICRGRDPGSAPIDIVMFCHGSLNEHVSTTTAGRLGALVGAASFPCSVSQQQGASLFTALQLATDILTAEPDTRAILIVAAEKWGPPFSRWIGPGILHGDAAGAILVERHADAVNGLAIIDVASRSLAPPPIQPYAGASLDASWACALLTMVDDMLRRHHLCPSDLAAVIGHNVDRRLNDLVYEHLGIPAIGCDRHAYLGAAESIVKLVDMLYTGAPPPQSRLLVWGVGLSGHLGCALLATGGTPFLAADLGTRDPSS
ncbi:3-Oxoacyl-(acyl-carrier-protein (ACP)) synthase III domain protein [Burkholderia ambifaria IOP40-10]|uniref:3-Oxoacyl-(Acyl-carrier-protein (ACP)) synthase III domain protein n=1 Tax=Burkholderia ambifaria IOP40-10 TaxID=396596 RepID=B1FHY0_9BURK|nr:3-Oxoacyl-(acyl-carrier-protein (ACP)) synthase III domain protein [Burkholderia ambifaria]EDT02851.1 3-Oxoacyl-(acyl-carrier-protein (ACP)) synthase III domain protein [Burkholderia ambifaria IOP40-10]